MGIKEVRRYRAYIKYLTRNEFIEVRDIPKKDGEIRIETEFPVKRITKDSNLANYLGNNVDIFI